MRSSRRSGCARASRSGFSNSYALGMRAEVARERNIATLTDLTRFPDLRLGLSHEFLGRQDGWPGLKAAYGLRQPSPQGIDHGLAYEALAKGEIDVIDLYTTDAKIERLGIRVLEDDKQFFPRYDAVILHRADARTRFPLAFRELAKLENQIDARTMIRLNARAEIDRVDFAATAAEFLGAPAQARAALALVGDLRTRLSAPRRAARRAGFRLAPRRHPRRPSPSAYWPPRSAGSRNPFS
jgi:osmoprotectant transport system permease protein